MGEMVLFIPRTLPVGKRNFLQVDGEMEPEVHHGVNHHFGDLPNPYIYMYFMEPGIAIG
jgi:hypothetical protein